MTLNWVWSYKGRGVDDINYWWGGGLMLVDGACITIGVCLVSFLWGPRPLVCIPPDWGWSRVVASTLNKASKRSISCMTSNTIVHNLWIHISFGGAMSYIWCMLYSVSQIRDKLNSYKNQINFNKKIRHANYQ